MQSSPTSKKTLVIDHGVTWWLSAHAGTCHWPLWTRWGIHVLSVISALLFLFRLPTLNIPFLRTFWARFFCFCRSCTLYVRHSMTSVFREGGKEIKQVWTTDMFVERSHCIPYFSCMAYAGVVAPVHWNDDRPWRNDDRPLITLFRASTLAARLLTNNVSRSLPTFHNISYVKFLIADWNVILYWHGQCML